MSTIKDIYSSDDLYTEAQLLAAPKLSVDDFETGTTYYVPEFVYTDIDEAKTKYYKLVEKTFDNANLFSDKMVFGTSSLGGSIDGGYTQKATALKEVIFQLAGSNFNGIGQILKVIDTVANKTAYSFKAIPNSNIVRVELTLPLRLKAAVPVTIDDWWKDYKFPQDAGVEAYDAQLVGGKYLFLARIDVTDNRLINMHGRGWTALLQKDGIDFDGIAEAGPHGAWTYSPADPDGDRIFGNDTNPKFFILNDDLTEAYLQLRLAKTNGVSFAGDYTLPAGLVLNSVTPNETFWFANITMTITANTTFNIVSV